MNEATLKKEGQAEIHQQKQEDLLVNLIKREAELKKLQLENKQIHKELKSIEKSKVWKFSRPLRSLSAIANALFLSLFRASKFKELIIQNKELKQRQMTLQDQLEDAERKLIEEHSRINSLMIGLKRVESDHLLKTIKKAKEDGTLIEYLDTLIQEKANYEQRYDTALKYAAKLYKNNRAQTKHFVYNRVLTGLKIEDIPEFIVREAETKEAVSLLKAASFKASLGIRALRRQLGERLPEYVLDHKMDAYSFVDQLSVKRPWVSEQSYNVSEISKQAEVVIKPVHGAGSRGVYLVFSMDHIRDVKRSQTLTDWDALITNMSKDLKLGWVDEDEWLVEELITEDQVTNTPARDLKFYCFYGKVALILEIQRYPEIKYCWWNTKGERISTGKYDDELFKGVGPSRSELELAATISLEIPTPFVRIDFLKTTSGLIFGEFTPKPGNYDEFDKKTDQWLGEYFSSAEGRLLSDLLSGKKFTHYDENILKQ